MPPAAAVGLLLALAVTLGVYGLAIARRTARWELDDGAPLGRCTRGMDYERLMRRLERGER